ncbi:sensor histidine kinase [Pedobacter ginsengisoli]|uniref:sensor histidine kinase n=1 Tax=Pedobacter ginsengisoli TaxID=363852 RepID=UPI00254A97A3|nr:histidine kinase [Pedobacter ginsengisoli]
MKDTLIGHAVFWLLAAGVLTLIYGTAFGSFDLGWRVIAMLLPVHMAYFYAISYWVLPNFFFRRQYVITGFAMILCVLGATVVYRLNEILISDPFIYHYYKKNDPGFSWSKLEGSIWEQLRRPVDLVNAAERSNVIVWLGVALQFVKLWYERRQAALQAELNFLKSQIHPHFLFNTLNNLYSLSLNESKQAPGVIMELSHILRYMLYECKADLVPLVRDIEILQDYISLEKIRYEERLDLNINITGALGELKVAPLLLLPLVENAFKHGASETVEGAWINIDLAVSGHQLKFKVSNGKPEIQPADERPDKIGLANIRKRLELLYPGKYHFEVWNEKEVFIAELDLDMQAHKNKS